VLIIGEPCSSALELLVFSLGKFEADTHVCEWDTDKELVICPGLGSYSASLATKGIMHSLSEDDALLFRKPATQGKLEA